MPRRSPGCEKCRARKVRCDERKPQCRRCTDYGVVCPGYRPPAHKDIQFIDQTRKVVTGTISKEAETSTGRRAELIWPAQDPGVDSRPAGVKNTYMHQLKLLGTFLSLYAPDMASTTTVSHYHALGEFPSMDLSAPLMQVAIAALGCAEVGTLHRNNERWIQEARLYYANALPMLAQELGKPARQRMRDDLILAVIVIFALCELFDDLTLEPGRAVGWFFHLHGALHHMRSKRDGALSTPFGELLFHHIRHNSVCLGAIQRKPVALAGPEWTGYTKDKAGQDSYIALYDIVVHIPGVLEKVDLCLSSKTKSEARELVEQLCDYRERLERWLLKWHGPRSKSTAYEIVDIREMAQFSNLVEDRTFVTVFKFKSSGTCSQMQVFNHFCSLCDIDILRLLDGPLVATSPTTQYGKSERRKDDIERDVVVAATSYCRGLPYCYEPGTGSLGRMGPLVLRILQDYFEAKGHDRERGWCMENKRMRQKAADERSAALKRSQEESTQALSHRDVPVVRYHSTGLYKADGKVTPFEGLLV